MASVQQLSGINKLKAALYIEGARIHEKARKSSLSKDEVVKAATIIQALKNIEELPSNLKIDDEMSQMSLEELQRIAKGESKSD